MDQPTAELVRNVASFLKALEVPTIDPEDDGLDQLERLPECD